MVWDTKNGKRVLLAFFMGRPGGGRFGIFSKFESVQHPIDGFVKVRLGARNSPIWEVPPFMVNGGVLEAP